MGWTDPRTWVAGEVVTAAEMNTHVRDNTRELWRELAYQEVTADVTVATSATDIVSSGTLTYDGKPIVVEWAISRFDTSGGSDVYLTDGTTVVFRLWEGSATISTGMGGRARITPSAGSHEYRIRASVGSGTGTVKAVSPYLPAHIRVMNKGA